MIRSLVECHFESEMELNKSQEERERSKMLRNIRRNV
jgi:UTP-glucose-1-phosphate uridylyltransferase